MGGPDAACGASGKCRSRLHDPNACSTRQVRNDSPFYHLHQFPPPDSSIAARGRLHDVGGTPGSDRCLHSRTNFVHLVGQNFSTGAPAMQAEHAHEARVRWLPASVHQGRRESGRLVPARRSGGSIATGGQQPRTAITAVHVLHGRSLSCRAPPLVILGTRGLESYSCIVR